MTQEQYTTKRRTYRHMTKEGIAQIIYSNKTRSSEYMNKNFKNSSTVFTFIFLTPRFSPPCFYLIVFVFKSFTLHISYYIINFLFGHTPRSDTRANSYSSRPSQFDNKANV